MTAWCGQQWLAVQLCLPAARQDHGALSQARSDLRSMFEAHRSRDTVMLWKGQPQCSDMWQWW